MSEAAGKSGLPIDARELPPQQVGTDLEQLAKDGVRRVAVSGGDGTIALAAELASKLSIELAVIPGGTLNHLAKHLGIPDSLATRCGSRSKVRLARSTRGPSTAVSS